MSYYKKIIGKKCYLSPLSELDIENWVKWFGYSRERSGEMIKDSQANMDKKFSIVDLISDKSIGIVSLADINHLYQNCSFNIFLPDNQNLSNGYGVEAISLILDCAFNFLNMHSVNLTVSALDTDLIECYKAAGFKEVGTRRQSRVVNGKLEDELFMDILTREYRSIYIIDKLDRMVDYRI